MQRRRGRSIAGALTLPVLFAAGTGTVYYGFFLQRSGPDGTRLLIAAALGACLLAAVGLTAAHAPLGWNVLPLTVCAGGLLCGGLCAMAVRNGSSIQYTGIPPASVARFTGAVIEDSRKLPDGRSLFHFRIDRAYARDGTSSSSDAEVAVTAPSGLQFSAGELLSLDAKIHPFRYSVDGPADLLSMSRGPQLTSRVADSGIRCLGFRGPLSQTRAALFRATLDAARQAGGESAALFQALLTGNQENLDAGLSRDFRLAGCAHILALSGMHLGILTALVSLLFARLVGKRPAYLLGVLFAAFYIWLAGPRPSLVRAGLMFAVAGFALVRGRKVEPPAVLSVCFCIQLAAVPLSGLSLSFQLSYAAIAGIVLVSPLVTRLVSPYATPAGAALVGAGVGAHIAVLPLVAAVFGEVFPIGLLAGIVLGPLVTLYMWSGLLSMVLNAIGAFFTSIGALSSAAVAVAGASVRTTEHIGQVMQAAVESAARVSGAPIGIPSALLVSVGALSLLLIPELASGRVRRKS